MRKMEKARLVLDRLRIDFPAPETELHYRTPFELLVAVILSAQCTDKRVNLVTPGVFERFPNARAMASASAEEIFEVIRSISYPNNKAKHLHTMATILVDKYQGEVPREYEHLLALPGVGRKTANVINSVLYREPRMAVDTHVFRVANRLGLTTSVNPLQSEKQLMALIPPADVPDAHHLLILHGRYRCMARKPDCAGCSLSDLCTWHLKGKKPVAIRSNKKPGGHTRV